jgi:hypothetical protein
LFTEAQLHKNPLTLNKILLTLPKSNILIKNYHHLKKEHSSLHNKFTTILGKINERIESLKNDPKKQRK